MNNQETHIVRTDQEGISNEAQAALVQALTTYFKALPASKQADLLCAMGNVVGQMTSLFVMERVMEHSNCGSDCDVIKDTADWVRMHWGQMLRGFEEALQMNLIIQNAEFTGYDFINELNPELQVQAEKTRSAIEAAISKAESMPEDLGTIRDLLLNALKDKSQHH